VRRRLRYNDLSCLADGVQSVGTQNLPGRLVVLLTRCSAQMKKSAASDEGFDLI